jgi:hypothetical protein
LPNACSRIRDLFASSFFRVSDDDSASPSRKHRRPSAPAVAGASSSYSLSGSLVSVSHCTPEQAVQMANEAGAHFIIPVHHQTFRFSSEGFREPIERLQAALHKTPERIALREIGETFVLL